MPKLKVLDAEATRAWNEWKRLQKTANQSANLANRQKEAFVTAFGDRQRAQLSDGRIVKRVRTDREGYKVGPKVITQYVLDAA